MKCSICEKPLKTPGALRCSACTRRMKFHRRHRDRVPSPGAARLRKLRERLRDEAEDALPSIRVQRSRAPEPVRDARGEIIGWKVWDGRRADYSPPGLR